MRESSAMTEIRKIREEHYFKYRNMTWEERAAHLNEVEEQIYKEFGIRFPTVEPPKEEPREPLDRNQQDELFDYNRLRDNYFKNMTAVEVCEAVTEYKAKRNLESAL